MRGVGPRVGPGVRDVDAGLGRADHREESTHDAQPSRVLALGARRGPLDGDLRGRSVGVAPFEMLDEVLQEARFPLHGEADGAAQRYVGLQVPTPSLRRTWPSRSETVFIGTSGRTIWDAKVCPEDVSARSRNGDVGAA